MTINKFLLSIGLIIFLIASGVYIFRYELIAIASPYFVGSYSRVLQKHDPTVVTVYFRRTTHESQILALKSLLERQSLVQSTRYISADQALEGYKALHQDDQVLLKNLNELGENPLDAMLIIKITNPSQRESFINLINANVESSVIDQINNDEFDRFNRQIK